MTPSINTQIKQHALEITNLTQNLQQLQTLATSLLSMRPRVPDMEPALPSQLTIITRTSLKEASLAPSKVRHYTRKSASMSNHLPPFLSIVHLSHNRWTDQTRQTQVKSRLRKQGTSDPRRIRLTLLTKHLYPSLHALHPSPLSILHPYTYILNIRQINPYFSLTYYRARWGKKAKLH